MLYIVGMFISPKEYNIMRNHLSHVDLINLMDHLQSGVSHKKINNISNKAVVAMGE